ncbi:hypothetical protein D3C72_1858160 [compost metagenome]
MAGERERQAQFGRHPRTEIAGSQQPDGDVQAFTGNGAHGLAGAGRRQVGAQFLDQRGKLQTAAGAAAQRLLGSAVAAGRAAQAQVDAARVQGLKGAELFGDDQRRVVGQHDAA